MRNVEAPDLVSTAEAAEILGKSIATVNRLAAAGKLPEAAKVDGPRGARFYLRADVETLLSPTEPTEAAS